MGFRSPAPWWSYSNSVTIAGFRSVAFWLGIGAESDTPPPEPEVPVSGGVSGGSGARRRTTGRGNYGEAWRRHFEQQQARLRRLSGELPRKKDRIQAEKSVEALAKAVAQLPDDYYSKRLEDAFDFLVDARTPREIVRRSRAAATAAERALLDMLDAAINPPMHVMTNDEIAAILLLS